MKQLKDFYNELLAAGISYSANWITPSFIRVKSNIAINEHTAYIYPICMAPSIPFATDKLLERSGIFAIDKITLIQTSEVDIYNIQDFIDPKFINSFLRIYVSNRQIAELAFEVYNKGVCQVTTPCWVILQGYTQVRMDLICPQPFTELTNRSFDLIIEGYQTFDRQYEKPLIDKTIEK